MDPVTQTLAQQESGSARGEGLGQYFLAGRQHAIQQKQLNLSQRRLELEQQQEQRLQQRDSMLLGLERDQLNAQIASMGIQTKVGQMKLEQMVMERAVVPEIMELEHFFSQNGYSNPEGIARYRNLADRYPAMFAEGGPGYGIRQQIKAPAMFDAELEQLVKANQRLLGSGLYAQGYNQKGGLDIQALPKQTGQIIRTHPDGTTEVILGAPVGDLTPTQRGNARQQAMKLEDTARRIGDIVGKADSIFGPLNATATIVVDRALSNLAPGLADGQRIQGRAAAGMVMEGMIRSLSEGQGALSNQDVQRLTAKFPELNNPGEILESPERARQILTALQKELSREAYTKLRLLNEQPTIEILKLLDPEFIIQEFKGGRLTKEQYQGAINSNIHTNDVNALIEKARAKKSNGR